MEELQELDVEYKKALLEAATEAVEYLVELLQDEEVESELQFKAASKLLDLASAIDFTSLVELDDEYEDDEDDEDEDEDEE